MSRWLVLCVMGFGCAAEPMVESTEDSASPDTELDSGVDTDPSSSLNHVLNPSFESSETWSIWGGAQRIQSDAHEGEWSLRATAVNGAEQWVDGLTPNTIYRLSGWGKTMGSEPMTIGVKYHGNEEAKVRFLNADYAQKSLEFTTGFGSTRALIFAYKHKEESFGYADDLKLIEVGPASEVPVWSDEFDGSGPLDSSKWSFEAGFKRNQELQWYQPENAFREDGFLVIEGRKEPRPNPEYDPDSSDWRAQRETIEYTSSSVTTKGRYQWQTGHLVVRAKVTNAVGTWPAIWTLGIECEWPSNGEVDVMENYGGNILANFAWGSDQRWSAQWDSAFVPVTEFDAEWTSRFHVWEYVWTDTHMQVFLDGVLLNERALSQTINGSASCEGQNPFEQPHYLLLNLALGSNGGAVDGLSFPTRYIVDYVRLYQ